MKKGPRKEKKAPTARTWQQELAEDVNVFRAHDFADPKQQRVVTPGLRLFLTDEQGKLLRNVLRRVQRDTPLDAVFIALLECYGD